MLGRTMEQWWIVVVIAVPVGIGTWMTYSWIAQGNAWRTALLSIAERHGLRYTAPAPIAKQYDIVNGEDRGIHVSLGSHDEGSADNRRTLAEISASGGPFGLGIARPGGLATPNTIDFSAPDAGPQRLGIPDFDDAVEVRGASDEVLEVLRNDAAFRAELRSLVGSGLVVHDGNVSLVSTFPMKASVTIDRYERVVTLALRLRELR